MKVTENTNLYTKKTYTLPSFGSKKIIKNIETIAQSEGKKIASTAVASVGIASIAMGINNTTSDDNALRKKLAEQKNVFNSGVSLLVHTENDINLIVDMHKINPALVDKMIDMVVVNSLGTIPRFNAVTIKNLVMLAPENPELLDKLIDESCINVDSNIQYFYDRTDIVKIMELAKENPELIEKIVNKEKYFDDGTTIPVFKTFSEINKIYESYLKNPTVVEQILDYDGLDANEIKDIANTFSSEFYSELKTTIPKNSSKKANYMRFYLNIVNKINTDFRTMDWDVKKWLHTVCNEVLDKKTVGIFRKYNPDFDNKIDKLKFALGMYKSNISTPIEKQNLFVNNILANNNIEAEEVLKNFDFTQYGKSGLPLKYSRADFIDKINNLIKNLPENEQDIVLQNFGFMQGYNDYDGLLTNQPLENASVSKNAQNVAQNIQKEIELFTYNNEVVTGNEKVDKVLTSLLQGLPEFAFFVGKEQHNVHSYSVDIHTLKVLQSVMNNSNYSKLSDNGKTILKMSVIMHDFGKKGCVADEGHASLSSAYASAIMQKFSFNEELKNRILDVIEHHHWFESYNSGRIKPYNVALLCRQPEDILIYEIFAKADFESVSPDFHLKLLDGINTQEEYETYMQNKMKPVWEKFNEMRSNANFVFDTKFMQNGEKFPRKTVLINGKPTKLKVLDFNELEAGESLQKYGFEPNVTKENAHFFVHMPPHLGKLESTLLLTKNLANNVAWSMSLVKNDSNGTVQPYGLILNADQANISIGYFKNLSLGHHRNLEDFYNVLFINECNDNIKGKLASFKIGRMFLRDKFLEALKQRNIELSSEEYVELAEHLSKKKYFSQLNKDIVIGNKVIKFSDIQAGLIYARESLFQKALHNEVESIMPTVKGLFAKASKIEDCPQEFLELAAKYDLPIVLMSNSI